MKNHGQIIESLRRDGFKITNARSRIIQLFLNSSSPLSAGDFLASFESMGIKVNKTTIYRELEFLLTQGYIKEIEFGEGRKRYELDTDSHHHHMICLKCKKVVDVELSVNLKKEEIRLEKKHKFKVRNHNLEFFGYCVNCN